MKTQVTLDRNRDRLGTLTCRTDDGQSLLTAPCLARSDNKTAEDHGNPTRDPLLRYGDLPTGNYRVTLYYKPWSQQNERMYGERDETGKIPMLLLSPLDGQAKKAELEAKRAGLAIHAGAENPKYTWWSGLRPTNGCLRLHQDSMERLIKFTKGRNHVLTVAEKE